MFTLAALGPLFQGIFSFAVRNWKPLAVLAILFGCWLYVNDLHSTINTQRDEYTTLHDQYTTLDQTCKNDKSNLEDSIKQQNAAVKKLNDDLKKANDTIAKLKKEQVQRDKENQKKLNDLLNRPIATDCPGAIDYLINNAGDLKWTE